ncbi:hypothetical protein PROFUN_10927 [Planoprotostelium fungivorum]|uniref:Uncharacterized protein n=1 Tax=Planoprotostelium fungivorum TaxID=1890364 RepID=A0A2P6NC08_9EUKA|nr:hypothetical protein PROFUN_10927 [Planoprotostelium fungivorum]
MPSSKFRSHQTCDRSNIIRRSIASATSQATTFTVLNMNTRLLSLTFACLILAACATPAIHRQQDRRGLLDGVLGGNSGGLPLVGNLLGSNGGSGQGGLLTGLPIVGGLLGGLPIVGGLLGDSGLVGGILGSQGLVNNLLSGLLSGKGLVVATTYSTSIYVHANVAANIAIDLPTTGGLLAPVQGIVGSILPLGNLLGGILGTTTVLNVQSAVDLQITVGVKANVQVALPAIGFAPIGTAGLIHGQAQVAICIDVSAEVAASVSLVTPVLNLNGLTSGTPGLLRIVDDVVSIVPSIFDKTSGRVVANLDPKAVAGMYMFVNIDIQV